MTSSSLEEHPAVDDWIRLDADGHVTVLSGKVELGQRISTAVAAIAAAELRVVPERVRVAAVTTGEAPDEGMTSGSNSIEHSGEAVRLAAATARRHLLALAAEALATPADALELADGIVRARGANRSARYHELLPDGRFGIPVDTGIDDPPAALDPVQARRLRARRAEALATGTEVFVQDLVRPGMLHARVVRPPHAHATLVELDRAAAAMEGVHLVREGSFVAVAADDEHAALRAAARVAALARWDPGDGLDAGDVFQRLRDNPRDSLLVVHGTPVDDPIPDPDPPPPDAVVTLEAVYERPYQMHGAIGPSAALAHLRDGHLEVWTHSQGVYPLRQSLAEVLGMAPERVRLTHVPGPGCYGHNGADDAVLDAALVARALPGRPVLLKWSREDEHAFEPYAPAMAVVMRGSVDGQGRIRGWSHDAFSDTHLARPRPGPGGVGPARLLSARWLPDPPPPFVPQPARGNHTGIHRNADPYYDLGPRRVVKHLVRGLPHRTSATRTLGGFANVLAIECFLDELAHGAGLDPLRLRLEHLADPRARTLLERVAQQIGWHGGKGADGTGRGLAFARYKNRQAYVAAAVEVRVDDAAQVHLVRAVLAADAGRIVDADGLASQLEGGFLQAASWTLCEQVIWDSGGITSRDWDGYSILGFDNVPEITVDLVDHPHEPPLGAGEAACGPAGAAIANAVFDATGLRVRRLPITAQALRAAAMA